MFKKVRLFFLIFLAFLQKEKVPLIFSMIGGALIFLFVFKALPYIPKPKPIQKIGIVGNYGFDNLPKNILEYASSGLTKIDEKGLPQPALAKEWQTQKDGKIYIFTLADEIFWQDGTKITTKDFDLQLPGVETEIIADKILKFTLEDSFSPFPGLLANPLFKEGYIGSGKYQIEKVSYAGNHIQSIFMVGQDKNMLFKFYPTLDTALQAFKLGEIDTLKDLYENPFQEEWSFNVTIKKNIQDDQYVGLFFNLKDKFLSDKNLRQALAYTAPKGSENARAISPINPNSYFFNSDVKKYNINSKSAERLFEKFKENFQDEQIKLTLHASSNLAEQAEEIKKEWEKLGAQIDIKFIDRIPDDFQILLIASKIPADPDQYPFWHSTQPTNITGYKSPKIDKILEDARKTSDKAERKEKYLDFQKFLLEDCPVVFLYHPEMLQITRKKFHFFNNQ